MHATQHEEEIEDQIAALSNGVPKGADVSFQHIIASSYSRMCLTTMCLPQRDYPVHAMLSKEEMPDTVPATWLHAYIYIFPISMIDIHLRYLEMWNWYCQSHWPNIPSIPRSPGDGRRTSCPETPTSTLYADHACEGLGFLAEETPWSNSGCFVGLGSLIQKDAHIANQSHGIGNRLVALNRFFLPLTWIWISSYSLYFFIPFDIPWSYEYKPSWTQGCPDASMAQFWYSILDFNDFPTRNTQQNPCAGKPWKHCSWTWSSDASQCRQWWYAGLCCCFSITSEIYWSIG